MKINRAICFCNFLIGIGFVCATILFVPNALANNSGKNSNTSLTLEQQYRQQNYRQQKRIKSTRLNRKSTRKPASNQLPLKLIVGYVPTPTETVEAMLRAANLKNGDVLYDLGSGDGRIPIAAARDFGVRAVGVEYDRKLVAESRTSAANAGVARLVTFRRGDLFQVNLRPATVVTMYLSEHLNRRLLPKLLRELKPGARIVSHDFYLGDWTPEQKIHVPWKNIYRNVFVWTVPTKQERAKIPALKKLKI